MLETDSAGLPQYYLAEAGEPQRAVESIDAELNATGADFTVDPLGISQMVAGSGPLRGRTLVHGIRRLRPGERLPSEGTHVTTRCSDDWYDVEPDTDDPAALREVLRETIRRTPPGRQLISLLSGGWDSRLLLALALEAGDGDRLRAYTTSSDTGTILEELVAAQVAQHVHIPHEITVARRDQFAEDLRFFAAAVDFQTSFHVWLVPIVRAIAERYGSPAPPLERPLVLDGLGGGLFIGGAFADAGSSSDVLGDRINSGAKYLDGPQRVLKEQVAHRMREHIRADMEPEVRKFLDHPHGHILTAFTTRTWPGIALAPHALMRQAADPITPFIAPEVIREGLRIHPSAHADDRLYAQILSEIDPVLAALPTAQEQVPWPRPHPRRITGIEAIRELRRLLLREPVCELVSPALLAAGPEEWRTLLGTTNGQHLIRGLATLSLWLETYEGRVSGFAPEEWTA